MTTCIAKGIENQYKPTLQALDNAYNRNFFSRIISSGPKYVAIKLANESLKRINHAVKKCQNHINQIPKGKAKGGKRAKQVAYSRNSQRALHQERVNALESVARKIEDKLKLI